VGNEAHMGEGGGGVGWPWKELLLGQSLLWVQCGMFQRRTGSGWSKL